MSPQKISQYSWRSCQPYENCYYGAVTRKQFSAWKVLLSVVAAFFVVIFVAKVLSDASRAFERPSADGISWHRILGVKTAQAALPAGEFSAKKMASSCDNLTITANETKNCVFGFFNTGAAAWSNAGAGFASVYTTRPNYRQSVFKDNSWYQSIQPAKMSTALVQPGQLALFAFKIKAPAQPGDYSESFRVALEDTAWIKGGEFTIKIKVTAGVAPATAAVINPAISAVNETMAESTSLAANSTAITDYNSAASDGVQGYGAQKLIQSATAIDFQTTAAQID